MTALCWHLPIFPGRHQPSIFGTTELNFRVRDGNGWTLSVINTNYSFLSLLLATCLLYHHVLQNASVFLIFFRFFCKRPVLRKTVKRVPDSQGLSKAAGRVWTSLTNRRRDTRAFLRVSSQRGQHIQRSFGKAVGARLLQLPITPKAPFRPAAADSGVMSSLYVYIAVSHIKAG